jgi:hypothetical protein
MAKLDGQTRINTTVYRTDGGGAKRAKMSFLQPPDMLFDTVFGFPFASRIPATTKFSHYLDSHPPPRRNGCGVVDKG